jgi:hypothetical protein
MSKVTLVFNELDRDDPRSFIEIIIARLNGAIKSIDKTYGRLYRVHDWVYVLSESRSKDRREAWFELKKKLIEHHVVYAGDFVTQTEKDADGSLHDTDYASENLLYLITQYMGITEHITAVRIYLADAGVFVDSIRRNPEVAHDAMRQAYLMQGKDEAWIDARVDGIINRHKFTNALKSAVRIWMQAREFGIATNDLYIGLWKRTQAMLLKQMGLPSGSNLRDNQSRLALLLEGVTEEVCAARLGQEKELNWYVARAIVQETAAKVGVMAEQLGRDIGKDIATNISLQPGYEMPKLDGSGQPIEDVKTPRLLTDDNI